MAEKRNFPTDAIWFYDKKKEISTKQTGEMKFSINVDYIS